jgi:hypothetical protein
MWSVTEKLRSCVFFRPLTTTWVTSSPIHVVKLSQQLLVYFINGIILQLEAKGDCKMTWEIILITKFFPKMNPLLADAVDVMNWSSELQKSLSTSLSPWPLIPCTEAESFINPNSRQGRVISTSWVIFSHDLKWLCFGRTVSQLLTFPFWDTQAYINQKKHKHSFHIWLADCYEDQKILNKTRIKNPTKWLTHRGEDWENYLRQRLLYPLKNISTLPSKCEALSSSPSTTQGKKKEHQHMVKKAQAKKGKTPIIIYHYF